MKNTWLCLMLLCTSLNPILKNSHLLVQPAQQHTQEVTITQPHSQGLSLDPGNEVDHHPAKWSMRWWSQFFHIWHYILKEAMHLSVCLSTSLIFSFIYFVVSGLLWKIPVVVVLFGFLLFFFFERYFPGFMLRYWYYPRGDIQRHTLPFVYKTFEVQSMQ